MLEKYFGQLSKIYLARFNMRSITISKERCTKMNNPVFIFYVLCLNTIFLYPECSCSIENQATISKENCTT